MRGRGKACRILQRAGGQPLHGGRVPRPGRAGLRYPRGRLRPGRGACGAGPAAQGRFAGHRGRADQTHGVQNHTHGPTCGQPCQRAAGRALRHRGPFTCAHARARRFRGEYSGRNRAGELRLLRHDGHAGHAERRGKKGRRDGLEPRWRAFRRVHPCVRGRRHDQIRGARQPIH